jgi:hypothetical protein
MFDQIALRSIIEGNGAQYRESSVSFIFTCPRCQKKDKLYIRKRDGRFVCFVCKETQNFRGRAEWALTELFGLSVNEIQARLYGGDIPEQLGLLDLQFDDIWEEDYIPQNDIVNEPVCWPPDFVGLGDPSFAEGLKYLNGRGITEDHIKTYQIRYAPKQQRVIFPIIVDGGLLGWQGRFIHKTSQLNAKTAKVYEIPKILTSTTLSDKGGQYLMFQDRLKNSPHCVLAEGPISAIKADLCGGNVASMGKAVTKFQLNIISRYTKKLYIALDPDAAEDIIRVANDLYDLDCYLLQPPNGSEDLGDATPEQVYDQFKRAPRINRGALMLSLGSTLVR